MPENKQVRGQEKDPDWRKKEESYREIVKKYPDVSPFIITQIDVQRRGIFYTDAALERVNPAIHQVKRPRFAVYEGRGVPTSLLQRDGTSIISSETSTQTRRDPYTVDVVDGKTVLTDEGDVIEEVEYWEKPQFFDKNTSRGTPMSHVMDARPQRYSIYMSHYCHFWSTPGNGCKYCGIGAGGVKDKDKDGGRFHPQDLRETMQEVVREKKGRFVGLLLGGGSILSGAEPFDDELEGYIAALKIVGEVFETRRFPCQVNSTALTRKQLERLYNETGITSYTTDLEVFDEEIYKWVCPGKSAAIPYAEYKRRLYDAVEIFGKGQVNTGIVSGVELATPHGFKSEEEALKKNFEQAEELTAHGVGLKHDIWNIVPGSIFFNQSNPSLDYYVRLTKGFYEIMQKAGIPTYMDNYRKCGMHPDINLDRV